MSQRSFSRSHRRRLLAQARRDELRRRLGLATTAAIGAGALLASAAQADTFTVTTTADAAADPANCTPGSCTLRDAIAAANDAPGADTVTFASGLTGTITLGEAGALYVSDAGALTVTGPGATTLALSGDTDEDGTASPDDTNLLEVDSGADLTLSGLTLTRGAGGSSSGAGAVTVLPGAKTTIRDAVLTRNGDQSMTLGGAIANFGDLTVADSTFSGNSGLFGGAIASIGARTDDSESAKYGPVSLTLSGSTLSGNEAVAGGGVFVSTKYQPTSELRAGRGASASAASTIRETTISGNTAVNGGGLFADANDPATSLDLVRSTLSGNTAGTPDPEKYAPETNGGGAAISIGAGRVKLSQSTITGNTADHGGGVSLAAKYDQAEAPASLGIDGTTISANTASLSGGGIQLGGIGTGEQNEEDDDLYAPITQPLDSTIVSDNTAAGAANDLAQDEDITAPGDGFVLSRSLVETPGTAPVKIDPGAPSLLGIDPALGALAGNGGATQTLLPASGSPVVDQGRATAGTTTDQRGLARTSDDASKSNAIGGDGTDIGAVELVAPSPPQPSVVAPPTPPLPPAVATAPRPVTSFLPVPTSRPRATSRARTRQQPITLRGVSSTRTVKVRVAVARKVGSKCRFLRRDGTFGAKRDCRRTLYVTAKGTRPWSLKLPKLARGNYTVWSRAIDDRGQIEKKQTSRNFQRIRIR